MTLGNETGATVAKFGSFQQLREEADRKPRAAREIPTNISAVKGKKDLQSAGQTGTRSFL